MKIGGLQKVSLIDFSPNISCVVFTIGCNFRCPYCHNPQLVLTGKKPALQIGENALFEFLEKRKKYLDGVVITGGEPTLQADLADFICRIKDMGFQVKLDTNGSNPSKIEELIDKNLLDFIAMDIKTDPERYKKDVKALCNPEEIFSSIEIIKKSGLAHEFRTTCVKPMISLDTIRKIAGLVKGADQYALQAAHSDNVLDPSFFYQKNRICGKEEMETFKKILDSSVRSCIIR